jgi:DNA-binding CsgD family transcriptional regulator
VSDCGLGDADRAARSQLRRRAGFDRRVSYPCVSLDLVGRANECLRVDEVLGRARGGLSGALVVRGEAGVGKTALLDYAAARADGFTVVHLTGVESEHQLGYAALTRLVAPMHDLVGQLPSVQRDALNSALGLAPGPAANPYLVGLGVISLAADLAGTDGRLLCLVDDAQWVDSESLGALAFWARRLHADRTAVIFGERADALAAAAVQGLPVLELSGLEDDAARALLVAEAGFELDRDIADRVLAETEGNPLAIIELAKGLTPHALIGWAAAPHPLPLTRRLEERFAGQVRALPADTQMFLLLLAADTSADTAVVWQAAGRLDISKEAAEAAEAAGLVSLGSPIVYRHPSIRSAVYGAASPADRRAAHRALAAVTDQADRERWAWHRAGATPGPDEEVAALLEDCGARATSSGASSAAVALLSRAAELTPGQERAAQRRVAAAEAAVERGSSGQARTLVEQAAPALGDPAWEARAARVRGLADQQEGNLIAAGPRLRDAAVGLLPTDPVLGRRTMLEAVDIALYHGDSAESEFMRSIAATEARLPAAPPSVAGHLLHAFSTHATSGYVAAAPEYGKAIEWCRDAPPQELAPWTMLIAAATVAVWHDTGYDPPVQRIVDWSRANGALRPLSLALLCLAASAVRRGQLELCSALTAQGSDMLSAAQQFVPPGIDANLGAFAGRDAEVRAKVAPALDGMGMGQGGYAFACHNVLLDLQIGRARYAEALRSARLLFDADPIVAGPNVLPDMIEAAMRVGDTNAAEGALARLTERATAAGTAWASGLLARSQALMSGAGAEEHYERALDVLGATPLGLERARTHLLYGEWLRHARRPVDARSHLRRAYEMFTAMGTEGFAERARVELLAGGERAPKRTVEHSDDLTPQEAQIAQLVGQGANNREIAAQLFMSPSTVEYHLHKVFRKLGVKSRTQLARRVLE